MPRGSDYRGPAEALDLYAAVVEGSTGDSALKGAKNPYTARNGHMFSFLDIDGTMALRLADDLRDEFLARYESGPVVQYGSVVHGYVSVPADLLRRTDELRDWFDKSYDWIGTLEPKPTRK
ncbi:MAG: TfoX/Sxy family protein [Acidimicrobiia bacterium]